MTQRPVTRAAVGRWRSWEAPLLAAAVGLLAALLDWRGVDLPAQVYRVALFRQHGLTIWDSQWYGGHWTLDYSVIFPPVAALIGVAATSVVSAAVAAWAFDRLVIDHFGPTARFGSLAFALGTVVQTAIGQLPFLMGEALALSACLAATRRRWPLAVALAIATSLASPLAGAFLGLAVVSWLLTVWPRHRIGIGLLVGAVAAPVAVLALLFPGQGAFPFPSPDFGVEAVICVGLWFLVPPGELVLRNAVRLYMVATALSYLLPSPIGGNVGRLGECLAIPLVACVLWPLRRWLLALVTIALASWQWTPAWGAIAENGRDPSTHQAYYQPVTAFLEAHSDPIGRVEVVPTRYHWEAAYVAPSVALARGWERQLDTADNPLFYTPGQLNPASYQDWLIDSGVRYVALPDAPLDYAAVAEARLIQAGVPGLQPVWASDHWQVFEVTGSQGIVQGAARLVKIDGGQVVFDATEAAAILVRVRYNPHWVVVAGSGCAHGSGAGWTMVDVDQPGEVRLQLRLVAKPGPSCEHP
jgi:hypothetical protein